LIQMKVEVKHLSINFTNRHDWPYRNEVIVDGKYTYDKKTPEPLMYVQWSNDYAAYICIHVRNTRSHWYESEKYDRNTERNELFYCVEKKHCIFVRCKDAISK